MILNLSLFDYWKCTWMVISEQICVMSPFLSSVIYLFGWLCWVLSCGHSRSLVVACGISLDQGSNPGPLHGVLVTAPPGTPQFWFGGVGWGFVIILKEFLFLLLFSERVSNLMKWQEDNSADKTASTRSTLVSVWRNLCFLGVPWPWHSWRW